VEHPTATTARQAFAALAAGDIEPVFALMTDDFLMLNDIGAGPWREVRGKDGVLDFWTRWNELFDGTFRQDITEVIGYDDRVVMLLHEHGTAAGTPYDNRAIYVLELAGDRWVALRTIDMDRETCEQFWANVDAPITTTA
jgi:ketosteroid isomerase-like protein